MRKYPLYSNTASVALRMTGYFFSCPNADKIYTMKMIIELLICLSCVYAIFIQLLRIIWLYFPSFRQRTSVYKIRVPGKTEMLLYFVLAIVVMAYFIFVMAEKYLQPGHFTSRL